MSGRVSTNKQTKSRVLLGCGLAFGAFLIIIIGAGVFLVIKGKNIAIHVGAMAAAKGIEEIGLPADQEKRIVVKIKYLRDELKAGNISMEQMQRIMKSIVEGPMFVTGMAITLENHYIKPSGLDPNEKEDAGNTIHRLASGLKEEKLTGEDFDHITEPIMTRDPQTGDRQLKTHPTDNELRETIARAKEKLAAAEIPEFVEKVNLADEFDRIVTEVLQVPQ